MARTRVFFGAPGTNRTYDQRIRSPLLYPLSYRRIFRTAGHGGAVPVAYRKIIAPLPGPCQYGFAAARAASEKLQLVAFGVDLGRIDELHRPRPYPSVAGAAVDAGIFVCPDEIATAFGAGELDHELRRRHTRSPFRKELVAFSYIIRLFSQKSFSERVARPIPSARTSR